MVYQVSSELPLYGQYARGLRNLPLDDANISFTNFAFQYAVLPNANLVPETINNFEVEVCGSYPQFFKKCPFKYRSV